MVVRATAMKANAVIGVDIDYEVFGEGGMMMVSLSGTAVLLSGEIPQEKLPTTKQYLQNSLEVLKTYAD